MQIEHSLVAAGVAGCRLGLLVDEKGLEKPCGKWHEEQVVTLAVTTLLPIREPACDSCLRLLAPAFC